MTMAFTYIRLFFRIIRIENLAIILLVQLFSLKLLLSTWTLWWAQFYQPHVIFTCLATLFAAAAGNVINDYFDVDIDLINKPDKVIVGKSIRSSSALFLYIILTGLSLFFGLWVNIYFLATVGLISMFLFWYSYSLKKIFLIGNLLIALFTAMTLVVVYLSLPMRTEIFYFVAFAFLSNLIREIVKDMEDMEGDRIYGCHSLPIALGIARTRVVVIGLLALLSLAVLFFLYLYLSNYVVLITGSFIAALSLLVGYWLYHSRHSREYRRISLLLKALMLLGIGLMLFV